MKAGVPKPLTTKDLARRRRHAQADDQRVVRHGAQLRPLLQPGRDLRRHSSIPEDLNPNLQRAILLVQQARHEQAITELRQSLTVEPHDPYAHALFGLCLAKLEKFQDATAEAQQAIHLSPDFPFAHYAHASILHDRHRYVEALAAINEALRLDSADADYLALLAAIYIDEKRWREALEAAERGLQLDSEHIACTNLRAIALVNLAEKRKPEQRSMRLSPGIRTTRLPTPIKAGRCCNAAITRKLWNIFAKPCALIRKTMGPSWDCRSTQSAQFHLRLHAQILLLDVALQWPHPVADNPRGLFRESASAGSGRLAAGACPLDPSHSHSLRRLRVDDVDCRSAFQSPFARE